MSNPCSRRNGWKKKIGAMLPSVISAEEEDAVAYRRPFSHQRQALADDLSVGQLAASALLRQRFAESQRNDDGQPGEGAAEHDRKSKARGCRERRAYQRSGHSGRHLDRPAPSVDPAILVLSSQRLQRVVDERRLGPVEQREGDAPDQVGAQQQPEGGREPEERDRRAEGGAGSDQRRLAPEAVGERRRRHLEDDDAEPEGDVDQRHLAEREAALLGQVDDPDRPPELEVEEEVEEVVLPDVRFDARAGLHGGSSERALTVRDGVWGLRGLA